MFGFMETVKHVKESVNEIASIHDTTTNALWFFMSLCTRLKCIKLKNTCNAARRRQRAKTNRAKWAVEEMRKENKTKK